MIFDKEVLDYLNGVAFSNGLNIRISCGGEPIKDRFQIIESLSKGKNIIHLGCVDHLPLIHKKIEQNLWLHARLCDCASRCLGIDINREGVEYIKNMFGYEDVVCANIIEEDIEEIKDDSWDYLVLGEVLEHVDNPCMFLNRIRECYSTNIDRLILTVPNAFSWQNITYTFSQTECINTDHRYWFTPYTLAKIISQAGMRVEQFFFCQPMSENRGLLSLARHPKLLFHHILFSRYPATRQTLLAVAKV